MSAGKHKRKAQRTQQKAKQKSPKVALMNAEEIAAIRKQN
jgi:hypothetical protein